MLIFSDIMKMLSDKGYSSYRIRKEKIFPEGTLTRLRNGQHITTDTIERLCSLCECQPNDLMRYESDDRGN